MDTINQWIKEQTERHPRLQGERLMRCAETLKQHPESVDNGLAMAECLISLNAEQNLIEAALLYHALANVPTNQLTKLCSNTVSRLISSTHNLDQIELLSHQSQPSREGHQDNIRKMLLAIVDDVRVVVLKLTEQLVRLNALKHAAPIEQRLAAQIVSEVYAPLANRLGVGHLKWQLEDWAFRFQNPDSYQELKKSLNMRRQDREQYVEQVINEVKNSLHNEGITDYEISGRAKHIFSIYKKIQRKQVSFNEIYDAIALRILVGSIESCYKALGAIHSLWQPIAKEFDDYITHPKPNGYRSIHTAVIGPKNYNVEIQIRTHAMHEAAELGVAAHWAYKEGGNSTSSYDEKITWLRQIIDWQQELGGQQHRYQNLFSDRVYVFTPQGDILDLPEKSTPLDFAYHVHSDIGHRCRGAKVNGSLVPLTHTLKTGDIVAIQTAKESKPSRDWLNPDNGYLQSTRARSKVSHWFRRLNYEEHIVKGQQLWEKTYRAKNIEKSLPQKLYRQYNFKTVDGLYAALGSGEISIPSILQQSQQIEENDTNNPTIECVAKTTRPSKPSRSHINIAGVDNLLSQLARCCKPIPGDNITGYITQGRGVTVHRSDCYNILEAKQRSPQRIVQTSWGEDVPDNYTVDLILEANDAQHAVRDITSLIATEKIPLVAINSHAKRIDGSCSIQLSINIHSLGLLQKLAGKLGQLTSIDQVKRF